jgi:tetratricopeptide (TPR) repeat protein
MTMTPTPSGHPLSNLASAVISYKRGHFCLEDELGHLHAVHGAGAPEAAIFYCARILEVLSFDALEAVDLRASSNPFSNLETLKDYELLGFPTLSWAHGLRSLGNDVRHIKRRVEPEDATLSVLFVERLLEWFFCHYRYRKPPYADLRALTQNGKPFALTVAAEDLRALIADLGPGNVDPLTTLVRQLRAGGGLALLSSPGLPAVLGEMLIDRREREDARVILETGLSKFPGDRRLNQMMGLLWSRSGDLEKALQLLEPLYAQGQDDEETAGITAGVYKRLWQRDKDDKWLKKASRTYRRGWEKSEKKNTYLGINAAATALWQGRPEEAREIAGGVRGLLQRRATAPRPSVVGVPPTNYWDRVTLADAEVLLGEFDAARRSYLEAFAQFPKQVDNMEVTRKQLGMILSALGHPETVQKFLG